MSTRHRTRHQRTKLLLAAITGVISGTTRAIVTWILDHTTSTP